MKLGMRKIVEEALEAEVADALGRGYYEAGASRARLPQRHRTGRLKTRRRRDRVRRCRRWRTGRSRSARRFGDPSGRTAELERLAVEMYARGLSTRDIEAAFADADGKSVLSSQTRCRR